MEINEDRQDWFHQFSIFCGEDWRALFVHVTLFVLVDVLWFQPRSGSVLVYKHAFASYNTPKSLLFSTMLLSLSHAQSKNILAVLVSRLGAFRWIDLVPHANETEGTEAFGHHSPTAIRHAFRALFHFQNPSSVLASLGFPSWRGGSEDVFCFDYYTPNLRGNEQSGLKW